jgi:hypothetical protein
MELMIGKWWGQMYGWEEAVIIGGTKKWTGETG